jgi:hypothetical protein
MTPPKHVQTKLSEALRSNLRRRKAQMEDRKAQMEDRKAQILACDGMTEAGITDESGVRYSGFAVRETPKGSADRNLKP